MKHIPNVIIAMALAASALAQDQTIPNPTPAALPREAAVGIPPQPTFTSSREAVDVVRQQLDLIQTESERAEIAGQSLPRFADDRALQQRVELASAKRAVQLAQAGTPAPRAPTQPALAGVPPVNPAPPAAVAGVFAPRAVGIRHGGAGALVIRSSDVDAKEQESLEQDLPVMARLLSKAIAENNGHSGYRAMGIDVTFAPGTSPIRSMYIEGYGALFMLNVGFPLLAPPARGEQQKEKPAEDSAWEQARHEVYGRPAPARFSTQTGEPYDEGKVNQLKDSLMEALKNATNIRGLKSDDSITVCVFGGGPSRLMHARPFNSTPEPPREETTPDAPVPSQNLWISGSTSSGGTRGSLLTIRVKKSDIESFAKGKINLDEFKHKAKSSVSLTSAAGDSGSSGTYTIFGNGGYSESWGGTDPLSMPTEP